MRGQEDKDEEAISSVPVLGFIAWLTSAVAYVLYLVWAFTPDAILQAHGVTYYPNKYWAIAMPTWICVTVVAVYWLYESCNLMASPSKDWFLEPEDSHQSNKPNENNTDNDDNVFNKNDEPTYFSPRDEQGILPVVEIPRAIITLMTSQGLSSTEEFTLRENQTAQGEMSLMGVLLCAEAVAMYRAQHRSNRSKG